MTRYRLKDYEESTPLYREAYRLCKEKLGSSHINTVSIGMGLANSLLAEGETDEAIPIFKACRKPIIDKLGHANSRVIRLLSSMGSVYEKVGDLPKAIEAFEEMLKATEGEHAGSVHEHAVRATIVRLVLKNDQGERAENLAIALLESTNTLDSPTDFSKMLANLTLGLAKVHNSKMDEASEFLEYVLSRRVKFPTFSDDENQISEQLLAALVEKLHETVSELSLFDVDKWEAVLNSINP